MKLTEHLFWYEGEKTFPLWGLSCGNTFIIRGGDDCLAMVDPGPSAGPHLRFVKAKMAVDGLRYSNVASVIITHAHPDHALAASYIAELDGLTLYAHELERALVENPDSMWRLEGEALGGMKDQALPVPLGILETYSVVCFGKGKGFSGMSPVGDGSEIDAGGLKVAVVETPGHRPGEIALYLPEDKALVAGDLVNQARRDVPAVNTPSSDLDAAISSIKKMMALDLEVLATGHEQPVTGRQKIADWLGGCERRCEVMKKQAEDAALNEPGVSLTALGKRLIGKNRDIPFHEARILAYVALKSGEAGRALIAARDA